MRFFIISLLALTQFASAFEPEIDGIYAVFDTSMGEFTALIHFENAPLTSANFIGLADGTIPRLDPETSEIVATGPFYDGTIFHFVAAGFFLIGGDPEPDNPEVDGPGYEIPEETDTSLDHNFNYSVSMINNSCIECGGVVENGENSTGSQFFITAPALGNAPPPGNRFNGHYSKFGDVIDGKDVVDAIFATPVDFSTRQPIEDVVINSLTIVRRGDAAESFEVTDYELPTLSPPPELKESAGPSGHSFTFQGIEGAEYSWQTSTDVTTWTEEPEPLIGSENTEVPIDVEEENASFVRIGPGHRKPFDYTESLNGMTLSTTFIGEPATFVFDDSGTGSVTIEGRGEFNIDFYQYARLPDGARLKVSIYIESGLEFFMFLEFQDGTNGKVVNRIRRYFTPNSDPQQLTDIASFELFETP